MQNLAKYSGHQWQEIEKRALARADTLVYSSQWAADFVIRHYKVDPAKVRVIPFGSNLKDVGRMARKHGRGSRPFHILFIGVSWERKGGDIVFETFGKLLESGANVELTVCGSLPPKQHPKVRAYEFLDKHIAGDYRLLDRIWRESDLFFLPTRADCTPVVLCEAAMYGLPILATDTGGVSSLVFDNVNGYCLPENAPPEDYKDRITAYIRNEKLWLNHCANSRKRYENQLNWKTWTENIKKEIYRLSAEGGDAQS